MIMLICVRSSEGELMIWQEVCFGVRGLYKKEVLDLLRGYAFSLTSG